MNKGKEQRVKNLLGRHFSKNACDKKKTSRISENPSLNPDDYIKYLKENDKAYFQSYIQDELMCMNSMSLEELKKRHTGLTMDLLGALLLSSAGKEDLRRDMDNLIKLGYDQSQRIEEKINSYELKIRELKQQVNTLIEQRSTLESRLEEFVNEPKQKLSEEKPGYIQTAGKQNYAAAMTKLYTQNNNELGKVARILSGDYRKNGKRVWKWSDRIKELKDQYNGTCSEEQIGQVMSAVRNNTYLSKRNSVIAKEIESILKTPKKARAEKAEHPSPQEDSYSSVTYDNPARYIANIIVKDFKENIIPDIKENIVPYAKAKIRGVCSSIKRGYKRTKTGFLKTALKYTQKVSSFLETHYPEACYGVAR